MFQPLLRGFDSVRREGRVSLVVSFIQIRGHRHLGTSMRIVRGRTNNAMKALPALATPADCFSHSLGFLLSTSNLHSCTALRRLVMTAGSAGDLRFS